MSTFGFERIVEGLDVPIVPGAVKVRVHRLRRRFRELLEEEVGATVSDDGEIDDEIRHLIRILGA